MSAVNDCEMLPQNIQTICSIIQAQDISTIQSSEKDYIIITLLDYIKSKHSKQLTARQTTAPQFIIPKERKDYIKSKHSKQLTARQTTAPQFIIPKERKDTLNKKKIVKSNCSNKTVHCNICLQNIDHKDMTVTSCKHKFHTHCILRWSEHCKQKHKHPNCPTCRALINPLKEHYNSFAQNPGLDSDLDSDLDDSDFSSDSDSDSNSDSDSDSDSDYKSSHQRKQCYITWNGHLQREFKRISREAFTKCFHCSQLFKPRNKVLININGNNACIIHQTCLCRTYCEYLKPFLGIHKNTNLKIFRQLPYESVFNIMNVLSKCNNNQTI